MACVAYVRPIATHVARCVVCLLDTPVSPAEADEPIEIPCGMRGRHVWVLDGDTHWRHLANTIERPERVDDETLLELATILVSVPNVTLHPLKTSTPAYFTYSSI